MIILCIQYIIRMWILLDVAGEPILLSQCFVFILNYIIIHIYNRLITVKQSVLWVSNQLTVNTLRPRQNGRYFADDTFKRIFLNENVGISITISLTFVPKGPINKIPALVQVMAWRQPGNKPLTEQMMVRLLTHICVTRSHWVITRVIHPCHSCPMWKIESTDLIHFKK